MATQYRLNVHRGTLTITGTFGGKIRRRLFGADPVITDCSEDTASLCDSDILCTSPWGGYVKCEPYFLGHGPGLPFPDTNADVGIKLTAASGFGDVDTQNIYVNATFGTAGLPTGSHGTDVIVSYSGTFEFVFTLETLKELIEPGFASYAGPELIDSPPQGDLYVTERFVPEDAVSVSISADVDFTINYHDPSSTTTSTGGGTASASDTITTNVTFGNYSWSANASGFAKNDSYTVSCLVDDWLGSTRPSLVASANANGATATTTLSNVGVTVVLSSGVCQAADGEGTSTVAPKRGYALSGVVRRMEEAYTGAELRLAENGSYHDVSGDSFSYSNQQERYSGSVYAHAGDESVPTSDTDSDSDSVDTWSWIGLELKPSWMTAQGIDSHLWPVLMYAFQPYDVMSVTQASEKQVSSSYSGTGTGDITRTLSLANGADADLDGTSWSGFSLHGYAYLVLRVKASSAGSPFKVKIGGKEWERDKDGNPLSAATTYTDFWIDLLNPTNDGPATDTKDSRWPYSTPAPIVVGDTWLWGVSNATNIVLTGLNSSTYDINWIKLKRDSYSRLTIVNAYGNWVSPYPSDTYEYLVRLVDGDTDGCRSKEIPSFLRNTVTDTYEHRTLEQVADNINGGLPAGDQPGDGWSATKSTFSTTGCTPTYPDVADLSPCYLNLDRYAAWLEGGGAKWDSAWHYAFDLDASGSLTLQAQMRFHRLMYWPPKLNPLELAGAAGDDLQLRASVILKGQGVGVVADNTGKRVASASVSVDGGTMGSGTTGSDGAYQTGTPYVKGENSYDVAVTVGSDSLSANVDFHTRHRRRVSFRPVVNECSPVKAVAFLSQMVVAWVRAGQMRVRAQSVGAPWDNVTALSDTAKTVTGNPALCLHSDFRVEARYIEDGDNKYRIARDFGREGVVQWSSPLTPSPDVPPFASASRHYRMSFYIRGTGAGYPTPGVGDLKLSLCLDGRGDLWGTELTVASNARGDFAGITELASNSYGLLYTRHSDGKAVWKTATDPDIWPADGAAMDTTITADVQGLVRTESGILVACTWDKASGNTKVMRSYDRGDTWEIDTDPVAAIGTLACPPALCCDRNRLYLVWMDTDDPVWVTSRDGGQTWS